MARTALTVQDCVRTGLTGSYTAASADGHAFNNESERVFLHVKNAATNVTVTVTVQTPKTVDGLAVTDLTVTMGFSSERFIGPFPNAVYGKKDTTLSIPKAVWVDYSATANVTVAAVKLPQATYA